VVCREASQDREQHHYPVTERSGRVKYIINGKTYDTEDARPISNAL
jgi:hypothetical protein